MHDQVDCTKAKCNEEEKRCAAIGRDVTFPASIAGDSARIEKVGGSSAEYDKCAGGVTKTEKRDHASLCQWRGQKKQTRMQLKGGGSGRTELNSKCLMHAKQHFVQ
jgi:hypothetical protein